MMRAFRSTIEGAFSGLGRESAVAVFSLGASLLLELSELLLLKKTGDEVLDRTLINDLKLHN